MHSYGSHAVDIDGELAKLDTDGYRPLRLAETLPERESASHPSRCPERIRLRRMFTRLLSLQ